MKTAFVLSVVVGATLLSAAAQAKDVSQTATIVSMNSVPCGTQAGHHKETHELLCHEYVLRSGSTEYHIRQKEEKKTDLLAIGQQATFTIYKDRMRLHATTTSGKSKDFEFALVLITAASEVNPPSAPQQ
ncbi:MAG: hypothetical protein ABSE93_06325 [Terriglobia bacterium]|jgi:hypothetical protein